MGPTPSTRAEGRLLIGSRGSPLALRQSGLIRDALAAANPGLTVEVEIIKTTGDRQQEWALPAPGIPPESAKGIFVKEIEEALLARRVDAAVHSLKDLPTELAPWLRIAAIPAREDPRDVLVARDGSGFGGLPAGARVGTGSPRRAAQLRHRRRDLVFVPIRGNVDTRLRKVREGILDAVVLAAAGLRRLGLMEASFEPLPPDLCLPAVGQGAIAVQTRDESDWVTEAIELLHDPVTAACVSAERAFLAALGGGCQVPVAALATFQGDVLALKGVVCDPEGERLIRVEASGPLDDAESVGREAARHAIEQGAKEILAGVRGPSRG